MVGGWFFRDQKTSVFGSQQIRFMPEHNDAGVLAILKR